MLPTMAATQGAPPRKKIATYGKAVRRRIPDYSFTPIATKSQTPEAQTGASYLSKLSDTFPEKQSITSHKSEPTTPLSAPSPESKADIFDVPSSDDDNGTIAVKPTTR